MKRDDSAEHDHLTDATMQGLNSPGGEEILERMINGDLGVTEGLAALAVLSGKYERTTE